MQQRQQTLKEVPFTHSNFKYEQILGSSGQPTNTAMTPLTLVVMCIFHPYHNPKLKIIHYILASLYTYSLLSVGLADIPFCNLQMLVICTCGAYINLIGYHKL